MSIYVIPALIALLLKVGVYVLAKKDSASLVFLGLLCVLSFHNAVEVVITFAFHQGYVSAFLLRFYYVVTLLVLLCLCKFAMSVGSDQKHKLLDRFFMVFALVAGIVVFLSDLVVAGITPIGYSVTANRGSFYFLFQVAAIGSFIFVIATLVQRFNRSYDMRVRLKCFYALFSLSPIIIVAILVLVAMQLGVRFNASALLPLASTCFLFLVVLSERNHDLINIRHYLLFSKARMAEKRVLEIVREHLHDGVDLPKAKLEFEKALVKYALDDSDGNIAWAADRLNVNRSSLYSMLDRLGIQRNDSAASK